MQVEQIMSQPVIACRPNDSLNRAAQLMWEHDCGVVPVVGEDGRIVGIVTDRDICIASYTQGRTLDAIPVSEAMAREVFTCHADDSLESAERLMSDQQVRRLPVVDRQGQPVGILSMNDIARHAAAQGAGGGDQKVIRTMAAIGQPRLPATSGVAGEARTAARA